MACAPCCGVKDQFFFGQPKKNRIFSMKYGQNTHKNMDLTSLILAMAANVKKMDQFYGETRCIFF